MQKVILLILLFQYSPGFSQDPQFSQFYANPVYLNPALAGTHSKARLSLNSRNEHRGFPNSYFTNSISYDQYVKKLHGGIALSVSNDMLGRNMINMSTANLIYAYHMRVTRKFSLSVAGQLGWSQKVINLNKLTFGDVLYYRGFQYDAIPLLKASGYSGKSYATSGFFDLSTGVVGYTKYLHFGLAAKHLNTPEVGLILDPDVRIQLPMQFSGHIGGTIPLWSKSEKVAKASISPNVIYFYQNGFHQLHIGTYANYGMFTIGAWLRTRDAVIFTAGIEKWNVKFGYSYDVTISPLTNAKGGSHEFSLGINFKHKKPDENRRIVNSPVF